MDLIPFRAGTLIEVSRKDLDEDQKCRQQGENEQLAVPPSKGVLPAIQLPLPGLEAYDLGGLR
jgi:hypothetical protein